MSKEIERKFLVDHEQLQKVYSTMPTGIHLDQGYLSLDPVVRIRSYGSQGRLTIKGPGLIERDEFEYPVPFLDTAGLLKLCKHRLTKIRYELTYGKHTWEVDEFLGPLKGLWLAEIELEHVAERFDQPTWLRDEVTNDPRYQNSSLVVSGVPV